MSVIKCTAAGDAMVLRRLPGNYPGFQELQEFIAKGDFRFFNLETTVHNQWYVDAELYHQRAR